MVKAISLKKSLDKNIFPFYIIKGDDYYLKTLALKTLKELISQDFFDLNYEEIEFSKGAEKIIDSLMTLPAFSDYRLEVVRETPDKIGEEDLNLLEGYLSNPNRSSILVLVVEKEMSGQGGANISKLDKYGESVDCSSLEGEELYGEIERLSMCPPPRAIEPQAVRMLASYTQSNLGRIEKEIEKLKNYCEGTINSDAVKLMVAPELEAQIFELSNAISDKNNAKALSVLDSFIRFGVSPMGVLSVLNTHFRRMLYVQINKGEGNESIAKAMGVKPAYIYSLRRTAKNFTAKRLKACVDYLSDLQFNIVKGKIGDESALKNAVLYLIAGA